MVWDNTILGYGATDKLNPLFEIDNQPFGSAPDVFDCSDYGKLSTEKLGQRQLRGPHQLISHVVQLAGPQRSRVRRRQRRSE